MTEPDKTLSDGVSGLSLNGSEESAKTKAQLKAEEIVREANALVEKEKYSEALKLLKTMPNKERREHKPMFEGIKQLEAEQNARAAVAEADEVSESRHSEPKNSECSSAETVNCDVCINYTELIKSVNIVFSKAASCQYVLFDHADFAKQRDEFFASAGLSDVRFDARLIPSVDPSSSFASWVQVAGATISYSPSEHYHKKSDDRLLVNKARAQFEQLAMRPRAGSSPGFASNTEKRLLALEKQIKEQRAQLTEQQAQLTEQQAQIAEQQADMKAQQAEIGSLKDDCKNLTENSSLQANEIMLLNRKVSDYDDLHVRQFLDEGRVKLCDALRVAQPGLCALWFNDIIDNVKADSLLRQTIGMSLSDGELDILKYGKGTAQEKGNAVAHMAPDKTVLANIICRYKEGKRLEFANLFKYIFNSDLDTVASDYFYQEDRSS